MKKIRRLVSLTLPLLFIACFASVANAAPYGPKGREIRWTQPNGEKLTLRVFGDELYARTETLAGYTVVYNPKDQAYHYAEISAAGDKLVPTGRLANLKPAGVKKGIDLPAKRIGAIRLKNFKRLGLERQSARWNDRLQAMRELRAARVQGRDAKSASPATISAAPVNGKKVGLTILVEFPDDQETNAKDPIDFPATRGKMVRFCNEDGYDEDGNTGSVRDYYFDQSNGQLTYTQKVTSVVTLPQPRSYYNYDDYPENSVLRDTGEAGNLLIQDAVASLKASGFNFSGLTVDATGNAIATNVFFAGPDSGVWAAGLWPHMSYLDNPIPVGTGAGAATLSGYQITNIEDSRPVIGTFCHENGHLLCDFPDLYSYVDNGSVGYHCLMSAGNYNNDGKTPAPINAHLKDNVGWAVIEDLSPSDYVRRSMPSTGNVAVRFRHSAVPTESYVIENRGKGDRWAAHAIDDGIMIWHIDETLDGNANRFGTDPHFGVALVQADGRTDLEQGINNGDGGDLFSKGDVFSDTSRPGAAWWNRSASGIRVKVLGAPSSKVSVQFGPLPPDSIFVTSPVGGEMLYRDSRFEIKWEANIVGDVKIDLLKGGKVDSVITKSTPNDGSFVWRVAADQTPGSDYSIRLSTITNPKKVVATSKGEFMVTDSTFPPNNSLPYGWYKPKDADSGWEVSGSKAYEGKYCLGSRPVPDAGVAAVAYKSNFKAGRISFYVRVSSEPGYDFVRFYIDGVQQRIAGSRGMSGVRDWQFCSYDLPAGTHTLMWTYEKDDSYGDGSDAAWLDAVELPATSQKIDVLSPAGTSLSSNISSFNFGKARVGRTGDKKSFTIRNTGRADLHGLAVFTKGGGSESFKVGKLSKKVLKPGEKATFSVLFAPKNMGNRTAEVHVMSNDATNSPFVIKVKGYGRGVPKVEAYQPISKRLKNDKDTAKFGIASVGKEGKTLTFRIRNGGRVPLTIKSIDRSGPDRRDFIISRPGKTKLAPLEATTFKVTFAPTGRNERSAKLKIVTNDINTGPFVVHLEGKGAPRRKKSAALDARVAATGSSPGVTSAGDISVMFVDGGKYRTLTVEKDSIAPGLQPVVEVSPDLLEWYRGSRHTTVVQDNAAILKVRDNTPVEPGAKRYIRLRLLDR